MEKREIIFGFKIISGILFSLGDDCLSVFVHMRADELAEFFLEDLDLETFEVSQIGPPLLLLNALSDSSAIESLSQFELRDLFPYKITEGEFASQPWPLLECGIW